MFAVIKTGGKQYKVSAGEVLKVEKLEGEVGAEIAFGEVLLRANEEGTDVSVGAPLLEGASVKAKILEQGRAKKITIIKYKPKVRYRRKQGHRQPFTKVEIVAV